MTLMLPLLPGVDQNVIHKDHDKLIQIGLEYPMPEVHEFRCRIRQSKGHHCKLKVLIPGPEHYLRDICLPNPQLIVTSVKAYLGVDSRSSQLIKQVINPRQWVPILDRNPVKVSVINAHSKGLVLLLRKQDRSAPW